MWPLLVLQIVVPPQPDPLDPYQILPMDVPTIVGIEVRPDSVLFWTTPTSEDEGRQTLVYSYSRADHTWARLGRVPTESDGPFAWPREPVRGIPGSFPLGRGLTLVNTYGSGQDTAVVTLLEEGVRRLTFAERKDSIWLRNGILVGDDTIDIVVPTSGFSAINTGRWAASHLLEQDTLWLGLFGYSSDNGGVRAGGIVAVDLRTFAADAYWLPQLRTQVVSAIARIDEDLWFATTNGVVIRDSGGGWSSLSERREDDLGLSVTAIAQARDTVWLATDVGPRGGSNREPWFGPRWAPQLEGDSIVMVLTTTDQNWTEHDAILRLGRSLDLGPRGLEFMNAVQALPRSVLHGWRDGTLRPADLLDHPSLQPFVLGAIR